MVAVGALFAAPPLSAQPVQRRLYISARDGSGAPIHDLSGSDLEVIENDVRRKIMRVTRANRPI